jgi:hypothetical protein
MTRSLELMQRSQFNAERMVQAGSSTAGAASAKAAAAELEAVKREVEAEMAQFQKLSQANQSLVAIVDKFGLQGAAPVKRIMNAK